ncbi:adenosylcobinamide kinase [Solibacillus sp. R5-41]|uniref:bifunctional adenosylcobinamide kinase/adenosylcobinamide-phosphate guanylyltransferase n=1 Tax=Solibacillus sp. R5-41 TaxID=2048654 RepID=UPI000C126BDE|nr:bifunctional adenosylcobinamide kinase/adenosylcobinamide-phosphate guanylyltransferase [Solibacillus sp. R5-41]ATP39532.1 adenosylcobinamide kinase [Solibacillus sp. R5-41]
MYVILGGAYNGKRNYVETMIQKRGNVPVHYCEGQIPDITAFQEKDIVVISDFETIVQSMLEQPEEAVAEMIVEQLCELNKHAQVICICTDQSRGVVPLEKEVRQMRDTCGRIYQKLCQEANTVIRVWYGLPQILKGEIDHGEK